MKSLSKLVVVRLLYANYQAESSSSDQKKSGYPKEIAQVIIVASKSIILQFPTSFCKNVKVALLLSGSDRSRRVVSHRLGNEFQLRSSIDAQIK